MSRHDEDLIARLCGDEAGIHVTLDHAARILSVTLDCGPGNRLGLAQIERLHDVATRLGALAAGDDVCRVVVLDAVGNDFCHGANLTDPALMARLNQGRVARIAFARCGQELVARWRAIPVPTVAAAQGHVVGAGACLFLAADFRCAAPAAQVRFPEIDRGMHLGWGIVPRLVSLLGEARALRLALLGEALDVSGLADCVAVDADVSAQVQRLSSQLAGKPPLALRAILAVLRDARADAGAASAEDAARWADTLESRDFAEAMAAWYGRRPGQWQGR